MADNPAASDRLSRKDTAAAPGIVQALGLGYRFEGEAWAFRHIDLRLQAGEIAVLAGRNGAGKTMLAKNLAGLLAPTEGKVLIEGRDLSSVSGSIAPHIGYVFQDARMQIVGDTVLDDVLFGPTCQGHSAAEAKARAQAAIAACRLSGKEERFSHQLSGGESRLLAIAGVLALCPKALLLDEPFANLDPSGVRGVLEVIQALALDGLALLVISHEIEKVLGLAKALFVMDSGRVVLSGRPDAVLREGIARYGLRDPFMPRNEVAELTWL